MGRVAVPKNDVTTVNYRARRQPRGSCAGTLRGLPASAGRFFPSSGVSQRPHRELVSASDLKSVTGGRDRLHVAREV